MAREMLIQEAAIAQTCSLAVSVPVPEQLEIEIRRAGAMEQGFCPLCGSVFLDGELGAKIAALEERIRSAEREKLLVQLAVAALEDDGPLPGADAEYIRARNAQAALHRHDADLRAVMVRLRKDVPWRLLTLGCAAVAVGCLAFLALAKASGWHLP
jgi:hypothetical protein